LGETGTESASKSDVVVKLEAEIESLRRELATLQSANATAHSIATSSAPKLSDQGQKATQPSTTGPSTRSAASASGTPPCPGDCARLLRKYHALSANFKTAKEALQRRKDERAGWIRQFEYMRKRIQAAEDQYGIQILDRKVEQMEPPTATALEADEPILTNSLSFVSDEGPTDAEPQLPELKSTGNATNEAPEWRPANSETTQGEASDEISPSLPALPHLPHEEEVVIKKEASSDIPEVVLERQVKKHKRSEEQLGTPVVPRIKPEMIDSSSPILSMTLAKFQTQESIDLGDIAQKIQTPRKRQLLLGQDGPQSETIPRIFAALTPVQAAAQQHPHSALVPRQSSALMPLSANVRMARPAPVKTGHKRHWRQLGEGIGSLAEDGATYDIQPSAKQVKTWSVNHTRSRLDALLHEPLVTSEDDLNISRQSKRSEPMNPSRHGNLGIPGRRQLPFDKQGHRSAKPTVASRPLAIKPVLEPKLGDGGSASPQQKIKHGTSRSLRHKPLLELRLEDFKVNPRANEGHDFAFSEVVRNKGERSCLPGCVDMHCCGKEFRALAISHRPNSPLTAAQRQEEQKLLEDYLGEYSYRLAAMDQGERMEVWIEAKTQELANKYGKHRHRFSRMQSPPGFWDADFPDTQQLETDKEEAAKRTRRAVAERHREAARPGGRWIFRDE
jgi:hypothetical protein